VCRAFGIVVGKPTGRPLSVHVRASGTTFSQTTHGLQQQLEGQRNRLVTAARTLARGLSSPQQRSLREPADVWGCCGLESLTRKSARRPPTLTDDGATVKYAKDAKVERSQLGNTLTVQANLLLSKFLPKARQKMSLVVSRTRLSKDFFFFFRLPIASTG
jgi:hypothetical protein